MLARPGALRPVGLVEVAVHEELAEREEPERDRVALDRPAGSVAHGCLHRSEVGLDLHLIAVGQFREDDPIRRPHLLGHREVALNLLVTSTEEEPLARAGPLQRHGDEDQRGAEGPRAGHRLVPSEHSEGQEQRVDAPLFERGAGRIGDRQEARLQRVGEQGGLEPEIGPSLLGRGERPRLVRLRRGQEGQVPPLPDQGVKEPGGRRADDLQAPRLRGR